MFSLPQCICGLLLIFCLHFRLGELGVISESTKWLLRDNERIEWDEYYDNDYLFDDYDYDDYDDDYY